MNYNKLTSYLHYILCATGCVLHCWCQHLWTCTICSTTTTLSNSLAMPQKQFFLISDNYVASHHSACHLGWLFSCFFCALMKLTTILILISTCDNKTSRWWVSAPCPIITNTFFYCCQVQCDRANATNEHHTNADHNRHQAWWMPTMMNLVKHWPCLTRLHRLQHPHTLTGHKITPAYSPTLPILSFTSPAFSPILPALFTHQRCRQEFLWICELMKLGIFDTETNWIQSRIYYDPANVCIMPENIEINISEIDS